jgi:hypothetical protein
LSIGLSSFSVVGLPIFGTFDFVRLFLNVTVTKMVTIPKLR